MNHRERGRIYVKRPRGKQNNLQLFHFLARLNENSVSSGFVVVATSCPGVTGRLAPVALKVKCGTCCMMQFLCEPKPNRKWSIKATNWPPQPKSEAQFLVWVHPVVTAYGWIYPKVQHFNFPAISTSSNRAETFASSSPSSCKQEVDGLPYLLGAEATYPEEEQRQKEFRKLQGIRSPVNHVWLLFHLHKHLIPLKRNTASLTVPPTRGLIIRACRGIASVSQQLHFSM